MERSSRRMAAPSLANAYTGITSTRTIDLLKGSVQEKRVQLRQTKIDRIYDMIDTSLGDSNSHQFTYRGQWSGRPIGRLESNILRPVRPEPSLNVPDYEHLKTKLQLQKRRKQACQEIIGRWSALLAHQAFEHLRNHCHVSKFRNLSTKIDRERRTTLITTFKTGVLMARVGPQLQFMTETVNSLLLQSVLNAFTTVKLHTDTGQERDAPCFAMKIRNLFANKHHSIGFASIKAFTEDRLMKSQPSYKKMNSLDKLRKHNNLCKAVKKLFSYPFLRKAITHIKKQSQLTRTQEGLKTLGNLERVASRRIMLSAIVNWSLTLLLSRRPPEPKQSIIKSESASSNSTHISERFDQYMKY